jgi:hypothetical protein
VLLALAFVSEFPCIPLDFPTPPSCGEVVVRRRPASAGPPGIAGIRTARAVTAVTAVPGVTDVTLLAGVVRTVMRGPPFSP